MHHLPCFSAPSAASFKPAAGCRHNNDGPGSVSPAARHADSVITTSSAPADMRGHRQAGNAAPRPLDEEPQLPDARVQALWAKLGQAPAGELDLKGLKKALQRIDHPMKNADKLLQSIMEEADTNRDGRIQYQEFCAFVRHAEQQLLRLFQSIDKDGNGKLDLGDLQNAFRSAGLTVSNRRLSDFFDHMDRNHDGFVSFEEWRNFLLFVPEGNAASQLRAALSYYYSVVNVTPEGDSIVRDDTLEGVGTGGSLYSLLRALFGSLFRVAFPQDSTATPRQASTTALPRDCEAFEDSQTPTTATISGTNRIAESSAPASCNAEAATPPHGSYAYDYLRYACVDDLSDELPSQAQFEEAKHGRRKLKLTDFAPDPGYFLAGAVAGGLSRTATAPLDRLKVYFLVNTKPSTETAAAALGEGRPFSAIGNAVRPFLNAIRELYRSGGLRGFFAGNGLNVTKIMPETAIKFGSYEAVKQALANLEGHGDPNQINSFSKFTAGGVAGMIAQFCVYPLDTLKFRLQCETTGGGPTGSALVRQTAAKMYADGGLRACYRGVTLGLVGMFPYSAIDMGMFELLKKSYRRYYAKRVGCHEDDVESGNLATGLIGATSGAIGATVVYPLNVVRTRLQTQGTAMHQATYTGAWDVVQTTFRREGVRGFYKGLTPNLMKVAPALSITWVVYENAKRIIGLH